MNMRPEAVGQRLRVLRETLELLPSTMADELQIDRSSFGKYERGERMLPDYACYRIAERYLVTMDFLYRGRLNGIDEPLRGNLFKRLEAE